MLGYGTLPSAQQGVAAIAWPLALLFVICERQISDWLARRLAGGSRGNLLSCVQMFAYLRLSFPLVRSLSQLESLLALLGSTLFFFDLLRSEALFQTCPS
jgi:hypothetical protein